MAGVLHRHCSFYLTKECSSRTEKSLHLRAGFIASGRHSERHTDLDVFIQRVQSTHVADPVRSGTARQSYHRFQLGVEQQASVFFFFPNKSEKKNEPIHLYSRGCSTVICGEDLAISSKEARQMFPDARCRNQLWMPNGSGGGGGLLLPVTVEAQDGWPAGGVGGVGANTLIRKEGKKEIGSRF